MRYSEFKNLFNIELPDYAEQYYADFIAGYNREKPILTEEDVCLVCEATRVPDGAKNELLRCADAMNSQDNAHFCGSFMAELLVYKRAPWLNYLEDPNLFVVDGLMPEQVGWVFVAVQLAHTLKTKNPPKDLNEENMGAFNWYSHCCKRDNGYWGICEWAWNMLSAGGCMFVFGILKFCPSEFTNDFAVITDGTRYVSLAANSYYIGHEGELVDCEEKSVGMTSFFEDESKYVGHVISAEGVVDVNKSEFDKAVWRDYLRGGDHTIDIHIPSKIPYTPEAFKDAYNKALEFYKDYYPEHKVKAITGYSWIFSPQLKKVMPADSNILNINNSMHLLPCIATFDASCHFIRQGSSLQQRIDEKCKNGDEFHFAVMYTAVDEIEEFGKKVN